MFDMHRLRWCFEYLNGKKKWGIWDDSGPKDDLSSKWWAHADKIAYAVIHAKHQQEPEIKEVVRCPGDKFVGFQYIAITKLFKGKADRSMVTQNVGLKMVTIDEEIHVFRNGKAERKPKIASNVSIHRR
jgi:hypothetical protein